MATIQLTRGLPAPPFEASDESGHMHRLGEYRGQKLLLCFLPADLEGGGRDLAEAFPGERTQDILLLGVMIGDPAGVGKFKAANRVPFPILCDAQAKIVDAYGMRELLTVERHRGFVAVNEEGEIELVLKRHSNPRRVYELLKRV